MNQPRRVFIQSFGCQMNDYDVARLTEVLRRDGYERTDRVEEADLVFINTCSVREKAEAKVASAAGRYREWKQKPGALLAIGGCVAQQEGARLLRRVPLADLTCGPDQLGAVPSLLRRVREEKRRLAATDVVDVEDYRFLTADPRPGDVQVTALVTVQKGCDNPCAFCIVPQARGREVSRPAAEVVAEVKKFVAFGAREVTLIGQNVNSYHGAGSSDGEDFAWLLGEVGHVEGLLRLRFTTSHPKDFTRRTAEAFRDLPALCPWLHLPVQSGSSRTLRRMARGYTRAEYLAKVDLVRHARPDIALTTDVIVGYPGETDRDFDETLSLLEEVQFDTLYSFVYSERPDTPALKLKLRDDVPADVKAARLVEVQARQQAISERLWRRLVGRTVDVLVEGKARDGELACGRAPGNQMINFTPAEGHTLDRLLGRVVPVRIQTVRTHTLAGVEVARATA